LRKPEKIVPGAIVNFCFVCSHLYPCSYGGAELRYYLLAQELTKMGHKVFYITYSYNCANPSIHLVPVGRPPQHYDKRGRRKLLPVITFGFKAVRALKKLRCDVVDVTVPYTPALFLPKHSFILTLHEFWGPMWRSYYSTPLGVLAEKGEKLLISRSKIIITPSDFVAKKVREHTNVPVRSVPLGLPLEKYSKFAHNVNKDVDVIAIGRFVPIKGWDKFVQLLKLIDKPLKVVVIGDGPLYSYLLQQMSSTIHKVEIRRKVSETEKLSLLSRAKYYLNLSQFEGFSIATLEALMCGACPIVLDTGYNAAVEIVKNLGCGFIIKSIEEAAELLATDPPQCTPNLSYYTIEAFVKRYLESLVTIYDFW